MRRDGNIVSYTVEEIEAMIARGEDKTDWERVRNLTDEEIERSIDYEEEGGRIESSEPVNIHFGEEGITWHSMMSAMPGPKQQVTLRLDKAILDSFKADGPGYQTRINAVLRSFRATKERKAS